MKIDPKTFFHQATIRICSDLDVHKSLENTMHFIKDYIPADGLFFAIYDTTSSTIRMIAQTTLNQEKKYNRIISIPERFHKKAEKKWKTFHGVEIINHNESDTLIDWLDKTFGHKKSSKMHMPLDLTGKRLGIAGVTKQNCLYTDTHSKLFSLLHQPFAIAISNALRYEEVLHLKNILSDDNKFLQNQLMNITGDEIIGAEFGLKSVIELIRQVAPLNSPVLILGESGVGKEVIANGIHSSSERKNEPFIKVNCGAIPENLIDSELFGHEKGAFTGAIDQRRGRFERAHKGTIFLDEIGELTPPAQIRLLRVLQNKEIERVGGSRPILIDTRIIAATNRDLQSMVDNGTFREDLWFRINVFPILLPPLRSRTGDIPALVQHFIEKKSKEFKIHPVPKISKDVFEYLMQYSWPGNVRELENAVERAIIRGKKGPLEIEHFSFPVQNFQDIKINRQHNKKIHKLDAIIKNHITQVLQKTSGKIFGKGGAAEVLEINPNTLRSKMKKFNISLKNDKNNSKK